MLWSHRRYFILSTLGIMKKLTQQYIRYFLILEIISRLAYKFDISTDRKIHSVFLVAQLELVPSFTNVLFKQLYPTKTPTIFINGDIDIFQTFEIKCPLNRQIVRHKKGQLIKDLVCWTDYGPEWDHWYNINNLNNTINLVNDYKRAFSRR